MTRERQESARETGISAGAVHDLSFVSLRQLTLAAGV